MILRLKYFGLCYQYNSVRWCYVNNGAFGLDIVSIFGRLIEGDRSVLSQAITLIEGTNRSQVVQTKQLTDMVNDYLRKKKAFQSFRIAFSGPPGAGKSSFIEAFGRHLLDQNKNATVAVLTIDPSSEVTGGSLLADKTRMPLLTRDSRAFIRPSPNKGTLGGITRSTNDAILLCEAAGYDMILVETVGVGQSEIAVTDMVDMFCLILPPTAGDEIQGLKRGIIEYCDLIIVNKCDSNLENEARRTRAEYISALKYMSHRPAAPRVCMASALTKLGISEITDIIQEFRTSLSQTGKLEIRRSEQRVKWMWLYIKHRLFDDFYSFQGMQKDFVSMNMNSRVRDGLQSPGSAADYFLEKFYLSIKDA